MKEAVEHKAEREEKTYHAESVNGKCYGLKVCPYKNSC
jgi:hypothetical protein